MQFDMEAYREVYEEVDREVVKMIDRENNIGL